MADEYLNQAVTDNELRDLVVLARNEEQAFFSRNPHLMDLYQGRLVLIALCQGAALQYIGSGYGVKDFDIHFFYAQNPNKPRLSRAVKRIHANVGTFPEKPIDFVRTVIPRIDPPSTPDGVINSVRHFLKHTPTANAWNLAQKAVVGLMPSHLYAIQIWPVPKK